ncbi:sensor histidine kinase (plasmid) [Kovacikia minuta CCNUW1]|uniref:sensor histidine kinase n=1 Tax=Kovacikia minuta TaxID=2931930 RepID=UPI001CCF0C47|nr:sensor histidine kinase [Kovacikia minuta]UBF30115.1 sensor histidine kinase [Kovacikia minuta CCNUW1]
MNLDAGSSLSLRRTLRFGEWLLLLMTVLIYVLDGASTPGLIVKCVAFSTLFFCLSFILPLDRPLWQRRAYIASEMVMIGIAIASRVEFSFLLFLLLIKACFLLTRREVILTSITGGIVWLAGFAWIYPSLRQGQLTEFDGITLQSDLYITLLHALLYYTSGSIFVLLLGFVIMVERESRQRAEALSQEVEVLGAKLERLRIAREIHDSLGHTLTSLGVQLEVAQKLRDRDLTKSFHSVDNAALLASQCLQDVRQLVQTMRWQSSFNLNEALREQVEQIRQQGIATQIDVNLPALSLQSSYQLYCVLKEGLINIQKHAKATQVKLRGVVDSDAIVVTLQDDGQGFDLEQPLTGCGLPGMQERVELLGGTLKISTSSHQGTQIKIVIPYDSSARR